MKIYKFIFSLVLILFFSTTIFGQKYNENGDFTIDVETLKKTMTDSQNEREFELKIINNLNYPQDFNLNIFEKQGWDLIVDEKIFRLDSKEEKIINFNLKTNSQFSYETNVISPDLIKISQKDNYLGTFEFPILIEGDRQNVSLKFMLDVEKLEEIDENYKVEFSTQKVSPKAPLNFGIRAENLVDNQDIKIKLEIAGNVYEYEDTFSPKDNYKIYSQQIPVSINPGVYYSKVIVRLSKNEDNFVWEWSGERNIEIVPYSEIIEKKDFKKTFLQDIYTVDVKNVGNIPEDYQYEIEIGFIEKFLLSTNINTYEKIDDKVVFKVNLEKGEEKTISYGFNYLPLYIIILVIIILLVYIYIRKNSNPLDVEPKIYEIVRVKHEGVKSMKIRIGFENIKEDEIENLRLIFRMPTYLNVKDNTFLLREPNHVLKGKNQYKLIWDFKRFEQNDSRIIGFSLVNSRGILGDIKIPDLEFEIKSKGKIKRYYKSFPTIKG